MLSVYTLKQIAAERYTIEACVHASVAYSRFSTDFARLAESQAVEMSGELSRARVAECSHAHMAECSDTSRLHACVITWLLACLLACLHACLLVCLRRSQMTSHARHRHTAELRRRSTRLARRVRLKRPYDQLTRFH